MKDFHSWQADMANSIVDASEFIKPCSCGRTAEAVVETKPEERKETRAQTRRKMADVVVMFTVTRQDVINWVEAYSTTIANSVVTHEPYLYLTASEKQTYSRDVLGTDDDIKALSWLREFKNKLN